MTGRSLIRYQPFVAFERSMNELMRDFEHREMKSLMQVPRLEVIEDEKVIRVTAEVAGVEPEKLEVMVRGDLLTLKGSKEEKTERREKGVVVFSERRFGKFERQIRLPTTVDADHVEAHMNNGVLEMVLPKKEPAGDTRKINISVG